MKKTDLITAAGFSPNVLAKLNKGEFVSMKNCKRFARPWSAMWGILFLLKINKGGCRYLAL